MYFNDCYACEDMLNGTRVFSRGTIHTKEEALEDHAKCHGWYHCSPSCCGPCSFCEGYCGDDYDEEM